MAHLKLYPNPNRLLSVSLFSRLYATFTSQKELLADINSCTNTTEARKLFDKFPHRNTPLYNAMIKCYTRNNQPTQALYLFVEMFKLNQYKPDNYTYPFVLKACSDLSMFDMGMSIQCRALVSGFEFDTYVLNSLLAMYMNCGEEEIARWVFDRMGGKTVVSWNTMINGYFRNGFAEEALVIFDQMMDVEIGFDHATVVSVLPACAYLKDLRRGRWVHEMVKEKGFGTRVAVSNSLVDMYSKCGCLDEARWVFDEMSVRDVISWTSLIVGYVSNNEPRKALALCYNMQLDGVRPNSVTVAALLSACVDSFALKYGKSIHGWVIRFRLEADVIVETALIDLYAKCNRVKLSLRMFEKTSRKKTVPWNSMISGYVYNGFARESIELFKRMLVEGVDPDGATLISLLPAYADLADLQQAKNIHCYLIRCGFHLRIETCTSLMDIYSKCGSLGFAHELFNGIPEKKIDIFAWSVIISGYGMHGHGLIAIDLFDQMVKSGVKPNEVTFTSVLHACSHAGLVDEGLRLFKSMVEDYQRRPRADHYTCIIDLLGRAGRLNEAYLLINTMPFVPNYSAWGALLGSCVMHEDVELGEVAAKRLFELEPENTGNYVLLSKIYAAVGRWEDAENVRNMMSELGLRKAPGCSSIEVRNNFTVSNPISCIG